MIWSIQNIEYLSEKEYAFYLSKVIRQFMEEEMGISMNMKQALLPMVGPPP